MQRPLVFDYQDDAAVRDIDDEYLLGPDLLVAPVLEAGHDRAPGLPARRATGTTGTPASAARGGRFVLAPTPMERIPLYARGGAVIPMWPEAPPSTAGYHPAVDRAAPVRARRRRRASTSLLQEDDGLTLAALDGARYRTDVRRSPARATESTLRARGRRRRLPRVRARGASTSCSTAPAPRHGLGGGEVVRASGGRFVIQNSGEPFSAELDG